jgi:hypothetical protein
MHEALLLRMSDEDWNRYRAPVLGSGETGDEAVDEWEHALLAGNINALRDRLSR